MPTEECKPLNIDEARKTCGLNKNSPDGFVILLIAQRMDFGLHLLAFDQRSLLEHFNITTSDSRSLIKKKLTGVSNFDDLRRTAIKREINYSRGVFRFAHLNKKIKVNSSFSCNIAQRKIRANHEIASFLKMIVELCNTE